MSIMDYIRTVSNFPKKGIDFYDISPLLANPVAWKKTIMEMKKKVLEYQPEYLVGLESRGFLLTAPLAYELGLGFIMIRKEGKLPGQVQSYSYKLEYGSATIEMQTDLLDKGKRVVLLDDVLATGGTLNAAICLLKDIGFNVVGSVCLLELSALNGGQFITSRHNLPFYSLVKI